MQNLIIGTLQKRGVNRHNRPEALDRKAGGECVLMIVAQRDVGLREHFREIARRALIESGLPDGFSIECRGGTVSTRGAGVASGESAAGVGNAGRPMR